MRYLLIILLLLSSMLYANPINTLSSWADKEYKEFRTYPRINKAQVLIDDKKDKEAKVLLLKSLKIDKENQRAINLLLYICTKEKDNACIEKYANQSKSAEVGYFYKKRAKEEHEKGNYLKSIKFAKKALNYNIKDSDRKFVKLVLFESYLKSKQYRLADQLIDKKNSHIYNLFKWSQISQNIKETKYAYSLAKELPNKLKYLKWRIELLLIDKNYIQASKEVEILNKIEPTEENKRQLLYIYSITGQNNKILEDYKNILKKGCDRYALKSLLYHYRKNKKRRGSLLEKEYPYSCLKKEERIILSEELIKHLKYKNPKKAKKIANRLALEMKTKKGLINLYHISGQNNKITQIYIDKLNRGCDSYALYFLLDKYKERKKKRVELLKKAYPYRCLSSKKQSSLSLELLNLLGEEDKETKALILKNLNIGGLKKDDYLYLSNLESSLGNYNKSIGYAQKHLSFNPKNVEAIKNIGYSYFKLNKKNLAIHYLMEASKLAPNDFNLLKNIGYLCIDLERYDTASYYWNIYLNKKRYRDSVVSLELAHLYYYNLENIEKAKKILKKYEKFTKKYSMKYYVLKAKISNKEHNCKSSLRYYEKALQIEKQKDVRYEQIHLLQQCNEKAKALTLMQGFVHSYPNNILYRKELAYMYNKNKNYNNAIVNFKKIKDKEPQKFESYTALAYMYKKNGQKDKAINTFKDAIDRSKNMNEEQRQDIKREITTLSKRFHLYLVQSARLNAYKQVGKTSPVNSSSYNGFGMMQLSYKAPFLPKNTTLYANISHNHKNIAKSIQPSVGIKYKPLKNKKIYLSAEQLIKVNKTSRSDTLLRASIGISGNPKSTTHENLYLESAYLAKADATILYGNYELGKTYNGGNGLKITPYVTTGATYSNDNNLKKSVTKMDIGVGVAVDMQSGESRYEIEKYKNKLKLEMRQKYAGNSKDKQALRLQWEFLY